MTPLLYHCPTAPANRCWIAQYPKIEGNLYVTVSGPTADIARAKLELLWQHDCLAPQDRKAFGLRSRLALLGGGVDEDLL